MIVSTATLCLAANIYFEARNQTVPGQYAVALVTMNRAGTPKKVCTEVFRPKQFSWTNKGVTRQGRGWRVPTPREQEAWELAQRIAKVTLSGRMADFTWGSTHYHSLAVKPEWRRQLTRTKRIGSHVFYTA